MHSFFLIIKNFVNENENFNEIRLSIQLPSNRTNVSMLTLSSPHLFFPTGQTFNALGKKYR
jgi:hypothetical protein